MAGIFYYDVESNINKFQVVFIEKNIMFINLIILQHHI